MNKNEHSVSKVVSRRYRGWARTGLVIALGVISVALIGLFIWLSRPEPPPELPPLAQVPEAYWVEAKGKVSLDDMRVPGRLRMNYLVYEDGRVVIPNLIVWLHDVDLPVHFLWWEVRREPLRCTTFRNETAIQGTLQGSQLIIPAGVRVIGRSYFARDSKGRCNGKARKLDSQASEELRVSHLPATDQFGLAVAFETTSQGRDLTVSLEAEGKFLNRPPVAVLEVVSDGVVEGCPSMGKGVAIANSPQGLEVMLRSASFDPDGIWLGEDRPKGFRVDLQFEQWARTRDGRLSFLGSGQEIGPVLFEMNQEHQLLLWVTDRRGAEARKFCHFRVEAPR